MPREIRDLCVVRLEILPFFKLFEEKAAKSTITMQLIVFHERLVEIKLKIVPNDGEIAFRCDRWDRRMTLCTVLLQIVFYVEEFLMRQPVQSVVFSADRNFFVFIYQL